MNRVAVNHERRSIVGYCGTQAFDEYEHDNCLLVLQARVAGQLQVEVHDRNLGNLVHVEGCLLSERCLRLVGQLVAHLGEELEHAANLKCFRGRECYEPAHGEAKA